MHKLSTLVLWIKRVALYLVIPIVLIMRSLAWSKINMSQLYLMYYQLQSNNVEHDVLSLPLFGKALFFILESISTICLLAALWYFLKILDLYKKGLIFTKEVIGLLKKINIIVIAWSVYQLFFDTIASLAISVFKPTGQRYISFSISFDDVIHLFVVLILLMLLHLLQEAHKMKSEQDLVV